MSPTAESKFHHISHELVVITSRALLLHRNQFGEFACESSRVTSVSNTLCIDAYVPSIRQDLKITNESCLVCAGLSFEFPMYYGLRLLRQLRPVYIVYQDGSTTCFGCCVHPAMTPVQIARQLTCLLEPRLLPKSPRIDADPALFLGRRAAEQCCGLFIYFGSCLLAFQVITL